MQGRMCSAPKNLKTTWAESWCAYCGRKTITSHFYSNPRSEKAELESKRYNLFHSMRDTDNNNNNNMYVCKTCIITKKSLYAFSYTDLDSELTMVKLQQAEAERVYILD